MLSFSRLKPLSSLIRRELVLNNWSRAINTGSPSLCEDNAKEDEDTIKKVEKVEYPLSVYLDYMNSKAYKNTYGDKPVWHIYVRNFKGQFPPETRRSCKTSKGVIITGSPCPICRDEYLLIHYENIKLLEQFISPTEGLIFPTKKTGICQKQQFNLEVAIRKAQNYGLLKFSIPHRHYDYSLYYKK